MSEVLQKYLASTSDLSRRQAESLIRAGKVKVNGKIAFLGQRAEPGDEIYLSGKKLGEKKDFIYLKLNKPKGYVVSNRVFKEEKNIFSLIPKQERLFAVGRLDKNSRGLILLTNDGDLANRLSHPRYEHEKEYEIVLKDLKDKKEIDIKKSFLRGIDIGEGDGLVRAKAFSAEAGNKFKVVLTQGKKRQLRRMFKALGLEVVDLKRTRFAGLGLSGLKEGESKPLSKQELTILYGRKNHRN